jgi:hypothetical protein
MLPANPMNANTTAKNMEPKSITARLLYLLSNLLVMGMVHINPTGNANNTVPSCASFKWRCCCMVGIRDAQVAKPKPEIK